MNVNPDSKPWVGLPYGHSGASWVLLGPSVVLRRTSYDVQAAAERIAATGMPDAATFVTTCILTTANDAEALGSFRTTLDRQQASGRFD